MIGYNQKLARATNNVYLAIGLLAGAILGYSGGYLEGLTHRPAKVDCSVVIPSFTKGETHIRLTQCDLVKPSTRTAIIKNG